MYIEHASIDGRFVLGSGTVIAYNNEPLKFTIKNPKEPDAEPLILIMAFKNELDNEEPYIQSDLNGSTLKLTFVNYNNTLGTGTIKPILIGDNPFANLYAHFRVYPFGGPDGDKTVYYTMYEVDKPKVKKAVKSGKKKNGKK